MIKKLNDVPYILLGSQRSGTTALAYAINEAFSKQDGMFTVNGKIFYFLQRWITDDDIKYRHLRSDEIIYSLKRRSPGGKDIDKWLLKVEEVLRNKAAEIANGKNIDSISLTRDIISNIYKDYTFWGDKYNEYLHQIPYIKKLFPKSKFILLIRNPYEISASVSEWVGDRPWRPENEEKILEKWRIWHLDLLELVKEWSKEDLIIIEYHRLCNGEETSRLSEFMNISLEESLKTLNARRKNVDTRRALPAEVNKTWQSLLKIKDKGLVRKLIQI